jgi:low affinity Fe/Cu permease
MLAIHRRNPFNAKSHPIRSMSKKAKIIVDAECSPIVTNHDWFGKFSAISSTVVGSRWTFVLAFFIIIVWAVTGPYFHYSDTWQLIINTGTTIVTFLMVFLIQNTQNRDAKAIHLKLNELIHAIDKAKNQMIDIERLPDHELAQLAMNYGALREKALSQMSPSRLPAQDRGNS